MSTATLPPWNMTERPPVPVHRFTVDEYHRLIEFGMLTAEDRVELLEGWITPKMPHNPQHDGTLQIVAKAVGRRIPPGWSERIQSAITTLDSQPEPDFALVRGDERSYLHRHPAPDDIGLIIEVADSSLWIDAGTKKRLYARAGIPCCWIVNLIDRRVEVYTDPTGAAGEPTYRDEQIRATGDAVPLVLDGRDVTRIAVADLLP